VEINALVEYIANALMDYPDRVVVKETKGITTTILKLGVHEGDIGKVIGKKGVTIGALRTILSAAAAKERRRIILELTE
jgi:hypothetical protein